MAATVTRDWQSYAERIGARFSNAVEAFIDCGRMLLEAKEALPHGEFGKLFENGALPFGQGTAERLMKVAEHPVIGNSAHVPNLPPSWGTLYELTKLPEPELPRLIESGAIHPEMERKQVIELRRQLTPANVVEFAAGEETCTVDDLYKLVKLGKRYSTVYVDPPWPYGNQATRAATGNHYDAMTLAEVAELPVPLLSTENVHLHLWTTNAFLFEAIELMQAWGFEYKSVLVWVKPQMGIGNYWRVSHEFLLFGLRGRMPFGDRSQMSWMLVDRTEHSFKPEKFRKAIERVSPGPYLELFGRRPATGWTVWGNEITRTMFDENVARL